MRIQHDRPCVAGNADAGTVAEASPSATKRGAKLEKLFRICRRDRRGAAVVEFAVVAPLFITLVFGMIEYGRMVMVQQLIVNAAREGARKGVLDGSTTAQVQSTVTGYLTSASVSGATVTVNPNPPSSAGYGAPVTVTVSIPFSQVSWIPTPMFLSGKTLTASSVMRRETVE
jgi:Flp pilus assembly protein TadG